MAEIEYNDFGFTAMDADELASVDTKIVETTTTAKAVAAIRGRGIWGIKELAGYQTAEARCIDRPTLDRTLSRAPGGFCRCASVEGSSSVGLHTEQSQKQLLVIRESRAMRSQ